MKITLSREEVESIIKSHFNISSDSDFILEIRSHDEELPKSIDSKYGILVDKNGFIEEMIPKDKIKTPFVDIRGRKFNYKNKCRICGREFYTIKEPSTICSQECIEQENQIEEFKKSQEKANKKAKDTKKNDKVKSNDPFKVPNKPKIDYSEYGVIIEDFLKSGDKEYSVPLRGLTPVGMLYRVRVAANLFGYSDQIKVNASRARGELLISRKG